MSLSDLGLIDYEEEERILALDGDIVVYRPCCVFNEDTDSARRQIAKYINLRIDELMRLAEANKYILFLTTNFNFRDDLVPDYKIHRNDKERPINLSWAKRWAIENLNAYFHKKLEADDLLGIYMKKNPGAILWSLDKDLRQIPGYHLDEGKQAVVEITEIGEVSPMGGGKFFFSGTLGFYFQLLTGDSTDYILGCGKRVEKIYKSGAKKGQTYIAREGIGPVKAYKIILNAVHKALIEETEVLPTVLNAVIKEYKLIHGKNWQEHIETQGNLLWMVRDINGETIKRWTCDGRDEYFDLLKGVILNDTEAATS